MRSDTMTLLARPHQEDGYRVTDYDHWMPAPGPPHKGE